MIKKVKNMKKRCVCFALAISLLFGFTGCISSKTHMPLSQIPNPQVIEQITTSFEINEKIGIGFLGVMGLIVVGVGSYIMANPGPGYESQMLLIGSITSGAGLGLSLIQYLAINSGKSRRITAAAREALLDAARQRHPEEEIDIRNINIEYVQPSGKSYLYNATGVVIKKNY
ncbi:MAG: hypothetical protein FWD26_03045 [Treponema sp.]|nr:hypothetical protein [Treponema sp.]